MLIMYKFQKHFHSNMTLNMASYENLYSHKWMFILQSSNCYSRVKKNTFWNSFIHCNCVTNPHTSHDNVLCSIPFILFSSHFYSTQLFIHIQITTAYKVIVFHKNPNTFKSLYPENCHFLSINAPTPVVCILNKNGNFSNKSSKWLVLVEIPSWFI